MADSTPTHTAYPPNLTDIERVELLHALSFHFEDAFWPAKPECKEDRVLQYEVICVAVERIIRRRAEVQ
jgi:hypothetical protein